jgi:hypothetical protein
MSIEAFKLYGTVEVKGIGPAIAELKSLDTAAASVARSVPGSFSALYAMTPLLAGAATVLASTFGAAVTGIWSLASKAAEAGGHLQDLSQQTNYSVETLSLLKAEAKTSGTDLDSLSSSLVIFQKNLTKSADGNDKLSEAFKTLGVTSTDNEIALKQVFTGLANVKDKTQQTALAMEVFGRSGKGMLGVIKETGGDIDGSMAKLRRWGLIVSEEDAVAADRFGDELANMEMMLSGVTRKIGSETLPAFSAFFEQLDASLDANSVEWKKWGDVLVDIILTVESVAGGFASAISNQGSSFNPGGFAMDLWRGTSKSADDLVKRYDALTNPKVGGDFGVSSGLTRRKGLGGDDEGGSPSRRRSRAHSGGGGAINIGNDGLNLLASEQRQYEMLSAKTETARVNLDLLSQGYSNINPKIAEHIRMYAKLIDVQKENETVQQQLKQQEEEQLRVTNSVIDSILADKTAISDLQSGMPAWTRQALDFIAAKKQEGYVWADNTSQVYLNLQALKEQLTVQKQALTRPRSVNENINGQGIRLASGSETRARLATPEQQDLHERIANFNQQMEGAATQMADIFDRGVGAAFKGGWKAMFAEVGLGFKDMLRQMERELIRSAILKLLQSFGPKAASGAPTETAGSAGGGGFLSGVLGKLFGGFRASGGSMSSGSFYVAGEHGPELISGPGHVHNASQTRSMMGGGSQPQRFIFVDDQRAAQEHFNASDRNFLYKVRRNQRQMARIDRFR